MHEYGLLVMDGIDVLDGLVWMDGMNGWYGWMNID